MTLPENTNSIKADNYKNASFDDWSQALNHIYGDKNKPRKPTEMWLRVVSDASKVGEAVRKSEFYEAMHCMVHVLSWIMTTTQKLKETTYNNAPALQTFELQPQTSLTGIILSKYPGICPYCGKDLCHCTSIRRTIERESKSARRQRLIKIKQEADLKGELPRSIAGLSRMFEEIYGQVHYDASLEKIAFHFLEEIGEVAWCITSLEEATTRNHDTVNINIQLSEEIADVTAWSFGLIGKLASLAEDSSRLASVLLIEENPSILQRNSFKSEDILSTWLWNLFFNPQNSLLVCPTCKHEICRC